jgi:murein DD-endopeptidase MepM/ murein hydrolase activator NlpD
LGSRQQPAWVGRPRLALGGALVLTAVCLVSGHPASSGPDRMTVSHRARALAPGELVILTVRTDEPLTKVDGKVFDHEVPFFETGEGGEWEGLVGIDLDTRPGAYSVSISAVFENGTQVADTHRLTVVDKAFPTRRLTVDESYVNPPAAVVDRIARESRTVREILARVSPRRYWSGGFLAPVPGEATSSFGRRSVLNGQPRSPHSGADFRAATGTPVRAPNAGAVVLAADQYFSGNTVILDHGLGLYSFLAHLSAMSVHVGDLVERGQIVGKSGATGRVTGPHLHWTVRLNGARVDPLAVLDLLGDGAG